MRRRSERKKSSSPAPVPARRSRRSLKVSENEKTEDEANVQEEQQTPASREVTTEVRASSEEPTGSPVRKSRGSRSTPKKRADGKNSDRKVEPIPEEPENGQHAEKPSAEEEKEVPSEKSETSDNRSEDLVKLRESGGQEKETNSEDNDDNDDKPERNPDDEEDGQDKKSSQEQEVTVPSPSVSLTASKDEEQLKTSSDVLDIQTEDVEEREEEPPTRKPKKKSKDQIPEIEEQKVPEEEEQKENREHADEENVKTNDEATDFPNDKHEASITNNQNNSTIATASTETPALQQQRSVRKRKWLTNKKTSDRAPPVLAISTDSLKNIIADVVQPVPLSDVQLESSSEEEGLVTSDRESERSLSPPLAKERVVEVSAVNTSSESTGDKEGASGAAGRTTPPPGADSAPAQSGSSKATVATPAPQVVRSPSPARNRASHVLYITNLVRPFTVMQLKGLLARTGKIVEEDGFWIDRIKSKCYVAYSSEDEAIETRHALHGVRWPVSNPKCLNVDFGSRLDMDRAIESTKDEAPKYGQENTRDNQQPGNAWSRLDTSDKKPIRPVREWDVGKKEPGEHDKAGSDKRRGSKDRLESRSRDTERAGQERKRSREREGRGRDRERDRDREREREKERDRGDRNLQGRSRSGSPATKAKRKENEPPIRLLDDLFRKTKGTPCIYWLPLTPEAIAEKEAFRQKRIEEHKQRIKEREERQKEREKDRDRQRDSRRNRSNERRRSRSRERERRRY
nr:apoptotic chromatin condensation inducer in the nucleus isoform X1 [Drosophila bipectinata]XP_017097847.2 apoptotic chromatin condensation inducer in the nucleus isoform X1 [Drosophila bipectinata]XP_043069635.1 apoptotic chromatin condensation inducer in the nucleus isoform X1 [Drosophila bipectinata]